MLQWRYSLLYTPFIVISICTTLQFTLNNLWHFTSKLKTWQQLQTELFFILNRILSVQNQSIKVQMFLNRTLYPKLKNVNSYQLKSHNKLKDIDMFLSAIMPTDLMWHCTGETPSTCPQPSTKCYIYIYIYIYICVCVCVCVWLRTS